jgi:hypothetical protein
VSRDRDRILEQALKHELSAAGTPPAGACLDAETLGAWTDGGLDPAAMAAAEAHVSNCARCQALVATMVRSLPVTEVATEARVPLWKFWLAPLAAGVTAVTLWMVIPEQQQIADAPAAAKVTSEAVVEQKPQAERENARAAEFAAGADRQRSEPARSAPVDTLAAGARDERQQDKAFEERKKEALNQQVREGVALADAAPRAAAAPAPPPMPAPAAPPQAAVAMEAPAVGALQKSARADSGLIEIPTLDPALGWRIAGDRLERSDNAGATWTVKRQVAGERLAAGSAPSNSVGWFVGRNGLVLLTTNAGATFTDVSLAEPLDLASVAAIDARSASVYSVVGRRFRTEDGGRTWRPF